MSQYDRLDGLILDRLESDGTSYGDLFSGPLWEECCRLEAATGRYSSRILDGRLQALRKYGFIFYSSKRWWRY